VALILIAYQRLHSAWGVSLILLADFLPGIALAAVFGTLADRQDRRTLVVVAEIIRAIAFFGLAVVSSFVATAGFALLAGVGTALFRPTTAAALPGLTGPERRPAAVALWGMLLDGGTVLGPALVALFLLVADANAVLLFNAATFFVSAMLLSRVDLGVGAGGAAQRSLWVETRSGLRQARAIPGVGILLATAAMCVLVAGMVNVAEPILAIGPLHAGGSGYALLVAAYGVGMVGAAPLAARTSNALASLRAVYVLALLGCGVAYIGSGLAPAISIALVTFALAGFANTFIVSHAVRLVQETTPERLLGRVFGARDTLQNAAFVGAFLLAGIVSGSLGARGVFACAGAGLLVVGGGAAFGLRAKRLGASPVVAAGAG
jgi:MFS family permease